MRKIVISIFAALILAFTLLGCGETEPLNVKKVTCVSYVFDPWGIYMTAVSEDLTIKSYKIYPESDNNSDLLAEELPPENEYDLEEDVISQEDWDEFVKLISEKKFMDLPEDLEFDGIYDGVSRYIKVETDEGSYTVGGYCAGEGRGRDHKRFSDILKGMGSLRDSKNE